MRQQPLSAWDTIKAILDYPPNEGFYITNLYGTLYKEARAAENLSGYPSSEERKGRRYRNFKSCLDMLIGFGILRVVSDLDPSIVVIHRLTKPGPVPSPVTSEYIYSLLVTYFQHCSTPFGVRTLTLMYPLVAAGEAEHLDLRGRLEAFVLQGLLSRVAPVVGAAQTRYTFVRVAGNVLPWVAPPRPPALQKPPKPPTPPAPPVPVVNTLHTFPPAAVPAPAAPVAAVVVPVPDLPQLPVVPQKPTGIRVDPPYTPAVATPGQMVQEALTTLVPELMGTSSLLATALARTVELGDVSTLQKLVEIEKYLSGRKA